MGSAALGDLPRCRAQVVAMGVSKLWQPLPSEFSNVAALLLVGGVAENVAESERFAELSLALVDVLGRSVLLRTLDQLRGVGISRVSALSTCEPLPPRPAAGGLDFAVVEPAKLWDEAWQQFRRLSRQADAVLVIRLGAWAEIDYAAMLRRHAQLGSALLRACTAAGEPLDVFAISSSGRAEAAALLRGELRDERVDAPSYVTEGYVNPLRTPECLRRLTLDALSGEAGIAPCGVELRPGVWAGNGARIHPRARVVAPAFIGAAAVVHRGALVTRGSSLEHHSEVDCGTVVESSSLLPYTRVGAGLEVEHSVAGFRTVHSLRHGVAVEIEDAQLVGSTSQAIPARALSALVGFFTFLPTVLWRALFDRHAELPAEEEPSLPPAAIDAALAEVESNAEQFAVTRRYGNE
jgi:carbonic anhydrase/acetyltransferase-like protein (isoleucine patch superfamily)